MTRIFGAIPPFFTLVGVILSFLIPFVAYKITSTIKKYGDPPWKNGNNSG
ncbi:hypothetical protein [uncultured Brevibacillus sp.]|nr:hypothetical protein [uncultured Brevibacillus sp.]